MKEKEIKVLMVEPGKAPSVTTIINELSSLQKAVSVGADYVGYIEIPSYLEGGSGLQRDRRFMGDPASIPMLGEVG